jgi:cellulose synthase (UDP-forming)
MHAHKTNGGNRLGAILGNIGALRPKKTVYALVEWDGWERRFWQVAALGIAAILFWFTISLPLSLTWQTLYSVAIFAMSLLLRRYTGTLVTLVMIVFSIAVSGRYLYWRFTETLGLDNWLDGFLGITLISAEMYALVVLLLGYAQTIWPLKRKPAPLGPDTATWPTVDIYVPTYNEPLKVVRPSILAALSLDWPPEKLKIYILDDGKRDEFREFAESVGVGYLTRPDNNHAKAGNLNAALPRTSGEYIAVFDCDHIPARSFLQMTMGWFARDPRLGMIQTPHHFLSADPFERNLGTFRRVPNEGELFYGLIQDGNDFWNATFFCGSCAILKRSALNEIGGVATETVTEDAHTALKMHRLGYTTAYLSIPQAAGLATESLALHVRQRVRWARGMAQIFRIDNPMLGKGLNLMQRLCYSNAMLHFFYGLPRMIFLLAPLSYLFFEAHIIRASAIAIAAYALPHLFITNLVNSRIQGAHRHSFWAEVYEATLAWYILRPTLVALINPKLGKFQVTAKGGIVEKEFLDWKISAPYLIMLGLNVAGLGVGVLRLFWWNTFEADTVLLNMIWTAYNLIILGAAVAVATESKQVRSSHRVNFIQKAMLKLDNGRSIACRTIDYSEGGLGLRMPEPGMAPLDSEVSVSLFLGDVEYAFPARVVFAKDTELGIKFSELSLQQQIDLVQCTMARADAWLEGHSSHERDRPLKGLREILSHSIQGYARLRKFMTREAVDYYHDSLENRMPSRVRLRQKIMGAKPDDWGTADTLSGKLGNWANIGRGLLFRPGGSAGKGPDR